MVDILPELDTFLYDDDKDDNSDDDDTEDMYFRLGSYFT